MINYPDFSSHGYQIERELGRNLTGGRITYLARDINIDQTVVIKQFQFAQPMGNWRDYDAIHQEIRVLQKLNHPSIPCYLNSFDTSTGFCLVQEYKNAPSLAVSRHLTTEDIQQIATECLKILNYLQQQQPVIIHRDIKPENILVSQDKKVYLVDFGLAKLEEGEISSTIAKGTFGFMPPEQIHNRQLTKASDLYSLGATLICLLTKTKSINIGDLIDENERINFKKKLPKLPRSFVLWLDKMVERKLEKRFIDAEEALKALNLSKRANDGTNLFKSNRKLIKIYQIGFLTLSLLTLLVYQGNKWVEEQRILAEKKAQIEAEKKAQIEAEQAQIEAEKKAQIEAEKKAQIEAEKKAQIEAEKKAQIEAEKKAQIEAEKKAQIEAEKKAQIEAQQRVIIIQLQEKKACVGCDLSGANLSGLFLENVNLQKANLQGANLSNAKLKGANLSFAKLQDADLMDVDLKNANLQSANLQNAHLEKAELSTANLKNANLQSAKLNRASLNTANLENANLQNADLAFANLEKADLSTANLKNADLQGAELNSASLDTANLENANLEDADLKYANLKNTNLKNANFHKASLWEANLDGAKTLDAKFEGSYR